MIGIEACGAATIGQEHCNTYGYKVKLIAPQFVKPHVKTNKNDALTLKLFVKLLEGQICVL